MLEQYWTKGKVQEYMYDETNPLVVRIKTLESLVESLTERITALEEAVLELQTPSEELDT